MASSVASNRPGGDDAPKSLGVTIGARTSQGLYEVRTERKAAAPYLNQRLPAESGRRDTCTRILNSSRVRSAYGGMSSREIRSNIVVFFGYPWTSKNYPWPDTFETFGLGEFLEGPLLQLNLDELADATGEVVGSGLLQIFLPLDYSMAYGRDGHGIDAAVRVVPANAIGKKDDMTPFPFESLSPLEICRSYWEMDGVPDSYDEPETAGGLDQDVLRQVLERLQASK